MDLACYIRSVGYDLGNILEYKKMTLNKRKIAAEILAIIAGTATLLALIMAPTIYLSSKMDNLQSSIYSKLDSEMNEFRKEIKDFHARLSVLEERSKG